MEAADPNQILTVTVLAGLLCLFMYLYRILIVKPREGVSRLRKQGIAGPKPTFLLGNILEIKRIQQQLQVETQGDTHLGAIDHDWPSKIFPFLQQWTHEYGQTFVWSTGSIRFLYTIDVEVVKELNLFTSLSLGKPSYLSKDRGPLMGHQSIVTANGSAWAHQKKIIAPEFYADRIKGMVGLMMDSTESMLRTWECRVESHGGIAEIKVDEDIRSLSADIISRACFGSNYAEGENIFLRIRALQEVMSKRHLGIPGSRYLPTKSNRKKWKLEEEINSNIWKIVKRRRTEACEEKDLLQMILDGAETYCEQEGVPLAASLDKFIMDNCKAIYFAGQETTAVTISWCLMLLAIHPDWQARVRAEVLEICKDKVPDADMLPSLKTLTMVIQETLRLYPPASSAVRSALEDIKLKNITIPKGMDILVPIAILHQHPHVWGPDAHQFNPERFANGISGATTSPQAFMPFGYGIRVCVGQHFAMLELKLVLSQIISKFSFTLSETYRHSPVLKLVTQPEHGISLQIKKLS